MTILLRHTFFFPYQKSFCWKILALTSRKINFFRLFICIAGPKLPRVLLRNEVQLSWEQRMFSMTELSAVCPCHLSMPHFEMVCAWCFTASIQPAETLTTQKRCVCSKCSLSPCGFQWGLDFLLSSWEVSTCLNTLWIGFVSWGEGVWRGVLQAQSDKWELGVSRLKKLFKKPSFN